MSRLCCVMEKEKIILEDRLMAFLCPSLFFQDAPVKRDMRTPDSVVLIGMHAFRGIDRPNAGR
jgi:hypothetical protein